EGVSTTSVTNATRNDGTATRCNTPRQRGRTAGARSVTALGARGFAIAGPLPVAPIAPAPVLSRRRLVAVLVGVGGGDRRAVDDHAEHGRVRRLERPQCRIEMAPPRDLRSSDEHYAVDA